MSRDVEDLLVSLRELLENSFTIPLGADKCVVNKDKVLAILDELDANMPSYLTEAKRIAEEEAHIIAKARREAESTKTRAEEMAQRRVSEQEVFTVAKQKAQDMLYQSEQKTRELRKTTNEYVDNLLKRTEEAVNVAMSELRQARVQFRQAAKNVGVVPAAGAAAAE